MIMKGDWVGFRMDCVWDVVPLNRGHYIIFCIVCDRQLYIYKYIAATNIP